MGVAGWCLKALAVISPLQGEKSVSVDGKCSDSTLLSNVLEEMKETLAKC